MNEWIAYLTTISAPMAGGIWGVALQPDFAKLSMKAKVWRWFLAVVAGIFVGPYVLHRFFSESHPSAASFWTFAISALSLAVGPILLKGVVNQAKRIKLTVSKDEE